MTALQLAWRFFRHAPRRTATALAGVTFALLLVFMQIGFYDSARNGATLILDELDADLVLVSPQYVSTNRPGAVPRGVVERMAGAPGVFEVTPVWCVVGRWRNQQTREAWNMLLVGVDPQRPPFRDAEINARLRGLLEPGTVLIDTRSRPEVGRNLKAGDKGEINERGVRVIGQFAIGTGYYAGATTVMSRQTLQRVSSLQDEAMTSLGLVRLVSGADVEEVRARLTQMAHPQAEVLTRAELLARERAYWLNTKPVGVMFSSGVLVAALIGAVILYQVLASEVRQCISEYATMKALGADDRLLHRVVLWQGALYAGAGYGVAVLLATLLYGWMWQAVYLPVEMTWGRAILVAVMAGGMTQGAVWWTLRKLHAADPAELFG